MSNADTTILMAQPPISSSSDAQPQETLLQRGMFDPPMTPGTLGHLDRFEILRLLGEGGMGQVYLAREPRTDTRVAVKILRPQMADDPQSVHRFLTEARHMYRLSHPRILRVLEVSDRKEGPYYVMPYVEGGSLLGQYRPGKPMPTERILAIASQVAEALAHAHAHGLIHRDLKPGNVLLEKDGNAYLTDFGLVRTVFNDSMVDASASHLEGTAPYMSPAVARGEAEDTRCDIYAFGALLYELLAGQPPYTGRTCQIILDQVLKGPPTPLREVNPKASPALVRIAEGCMARELHARYTTMTDVVSDLALAAKGALPLGPHQQEHRRRLPRLAALLAGTLAFAALAGVAVHHFSRQNPPRPEVAGHLGSAGSPSTLPVARELQAPLPPGTRFVRPPTPGIRRTASGVLAQTGVLTATSPSNFTYTTNNGAITIAKYTGPNGAVVIPEKIDGQPVTCIGDYAFIYRSDVTNVTTPDSVTHIGTGAFFCCGSLASVTLPSSLIDLGGEAFAYCGLSTITIPAGVTSMGGNPFVCGRLTAVTVDAANPSFSSSADGIVFNKDKSTLVCYPAGKAGSYVIPNSVTKIGAGALSGCSNLTSLTIPNSVTNIGPWAIQCERLTDIVIPDSVVSIEDGAFQNNPSLTNVTIPKNVSSIGKMVFRYCRGLRTIVVDEANPAYSSVDGVLFNKARTRLVGYPGGRAGSYPVPDGVIEIDFQAFHGCAALTSVILPASVTHMGPGAFSNCGGLTAVYFNGNAPWADENVFAENKKVTAYYRPGTKGWGPTFGGRPTAVWKEAGAGEPTANSLQPSNPYTYTTNNDAITITKYTGPAGEVVIPEQIDGLPVVTIGGGAFAGCASMTDITISASVSGIEAYAFADCKGLTRIDLPSNVTNAGSLSFAGCDRLTAINVAPENPAFSSDENGVLFNKAKTKLVRYPGGKKGEYAIPDGTRVLEEWAFSLCGSLTAITVPASVSSIPSGGVFGGCPLLQRIDVDLANPAFSSSKDGVLFNKDKTTLIRCPGGMAGKYEIPSGVRQIAHTAFSSCQQLVTVTIPDSTTSVGEQVFINCSNLTDITIPNGITRIGDCMFWHCSSLARVTVGQSVTNITEVFLSCRNLESVRFLGDTPTLGQEVFKDANKATVYYRPGTTGWGPTFGGRPTAVWDGVGTVQPTAHSQQPTATQPTATQPTAIPYIYTTNNGAITITKYTGPGGDVTIPRSINGLPVTSLGYCVFSRGDLTSLTIPDSVTRFEAFAIWYCSGLTNLTIPKSVTTIESGGVGGCNKLLFIKVDEANPVYSSVDGVVFNKEKTRLLYYPPGRVGNYVVSDRIASIGNEAFSTCANLTGITIPNSVTNIGEWAFSECLGLTNVIVPASVTGLGVGAFRGCKGLNALVVDAANPAYSSVDGILFNKEKTSLLWYPNGRAGSYSIPDRVAHIGAYAFQPNSLTNVVIPASVTHIGEDAFRDSANLTSLIIPESVTNIGNFAFRWCPNMTNIVIQTSKASILAYSFEACSGLISFTVDAANTAYRSAGGVLFNKDKTLLVCCPGGTAGSYEIPHGVTKIGPAAFKHCGSLINVMIPNSVMDISSDAFRNCGNLKGVYFKGHAPTLGENVFAESGKVVVRYQPEAMGWDAEFGGRPTAVWKTSSMAQGISSILPAFGTNQNGVLRRTGLRSPSQLLNAIALPAIPTPVTAQPIANSPQPPIPYTYTTNNGAITITQYTGPGGEVVIPDKINGLPVTGIGNTSFMYRGDVTQVTIPSSVISIGGWAFGLCSSLTNVAIPSSVISIGGWAFRDCTNLTSVTIPNRVTNIDLNPFSGCDRLALKVDSANPAYSSSADGILFNKEKTCLVSYPSGKAGSYVIPKGITAISYAAFSGCPNLTSVTIPNSVISMANPFDVCRGLSLISVDAANPAYSSSADGVLFNKEKTRLVSCPRSKVGNYAIPNSVTNIEHQAFCSCVHLTSVTIPDSVINISDQAFRVCTDLTSITIPNSVNRIEWGSFLECTSLTNVTVSESVTNISSHAFGGCANLTAVYFKGNAPSGGTDSSVFGASDKVTVYFRPGTTGWGKEFGGRPTAEWKQ